VSHVLVLARHAPLFRNLVRREIRQRYKGSALGLVWTLINPAVTVGAYTLVFQYLFKVPIPNFAVFLFVGLTIWAFFLGGAQTAASSLVANANLVKKVAFPREIIPLSAMAGNAFTAGAMLAVALPLCLAFTPGSRVTLIALPGLIVLLGILTTGFGLLLAGINVYFRDVEHILGAIALPWFFLTPILYTFDQLPGGAEANQTLVDVLHWGNPIAPFALAIQDSLYWGRWPDMADVTYCAVVAAIMLAIGVAAFRRLKREMAVEL
jgi:ABC-type polysaccharide/polyol phosphate export permease